MTEYGQISVYGTGVKGPLLVSRDARLIQIRNRQGDLTAMFVRLAGDIWGFLTPADPDWDATVARTAVEDANVPLTDAQAAVVKEAKD